MSDIKLIPKSYSYVLKKHKETVEESIYIQCSYEDLVLNYEDIEENKELYGKIKTINLHFKKNKETISKEEKNSSEEKSFDEIGIGNIRVNVYSAHGDEFYGIDSHISITNVEFDYLKKFVHENIKIELIYLTIEYGMEDEDVLEGIFYWSQTSYLSKEWKMSPSSNNILPIFGYELRTERIVEESTDKFEIDREREELERTNRENLKEDINEVLHNNIIFQHHTKQFDDIKIRVERLNSGIEKSFQKIIVIFIVLILIGIFK